MHKLIPALNTPSIQQTAGPSPWETAPKSIVPLVAFFSLAGNLDVTLGENAQINAGNIGIGGLGTTNITLGVGSKIHSTGIFGIYNKYSANITLQDNTEVQGSNFGVRSTVGPIDMTMVSGSKIIATGGAGTGIWASTSADTITISGYVKGEHNLFSFGAEMIS